MSFQAIHNPEPLKPIGKMSPFIEPRVFRIMYETNFDFCSRKADANSRLHHNEHAWRHQLAWSSSNKILADWGRDKCEMPSDTQPTKDWLASARDCNILWLRFQAVRIYD